MLDTIRVKFPIAPTDEQLKGWTKRTTTTTTGINTVYMYNPAVGETTLRFTYRPVDYTGNPMLSLECSLPKLVFDNNYQMLGSIDEAIKIANLRLSCSSLLISNCSESSTSFCCLSGGMRSQRALIATSRGLGRGSSRASYTSNPNVFTNKSIFSVPGLRAPFIHIESKGRLMPKKFAKSSSVFRLPCSCCHFRYWRSRKSGKRVAIAIV